MNERDEYATKQAIKAMADAQQRQLIKDAIKELLGEYVNTFGWWSTRTLALLVLGAAIMFVLQVNGWSK